MIAYLGVSDREFAQKIGVSASLVNRILRGDRSEEKMSPSVVLGTLAELGLEKAYWTSDQPPERFLGAPSDHRDLVRAVEDLGDVPQTQIDSARDEVRRLSEATQRWYIGRVALRVVPPGAVQKLARAALSDDEVARLATQHPPTSDRARLVRRLDVFWFGATLDALGYPELTDFGDVSAAALLEASLAPNPPFATAQEISRLGGDAETVAKARAGVRPDLVGWQAIANALGVSVRTAKRWERDGLPLANYGSVNVAAYRDRILEWQRARSEVAAERPPVADTTVDNVPKGHDTPSRRRRRGSGTRR